MALSKALEELLALIGDEGDREAQRKLLEKHEVLRERNEGYLRQADYDKQFNAVKAERLKEKEEIEKARGNIDKWQKWWDDNQKIHNDTITANKNLLKEKTTWTEQEKLLRKQIEAAASGSGAGGDDVNLAAVQQAVEDRIKDLPYVSKDAVATIVAEETSKAVKTEREAVEQRLMKETLPAWSSVIMDYNDVMYQHQAEFKEGLDRKALADFMQVNNITDVKKGHEAFVAPKRKEAEATKMREEITASVRKEMMPVPGSGAAPALRDLGPVAQRVQHDASEAIKNGTGTRVGDGSAARAAAASLIEKGKY